MNLRKSLKITKRLILLTVMLALAVPCAAMADTAVEADIQNLEIGREQFTLYIDQTQGEVFYPTVRDISASFGKQKCQILDCKNLKDAKLGVAYDCIVDVSGSMDKARMEDVKSMLTQLNHDKKPEDSIRITKMANERTSTDFIKDVEEIDGVIDTLEVTHEDTNLYDSLKKELEELVANKDLPRRRCILIFSDGCEDQKKGITKDELIKTIKDNSIPVFTVALLPKKAKEADIEAAKLLGSFGRSSYGGAHYAPAVDGSVYEELIKEIIGIANDSMIVTVDISDIKLRRNSVILNLKMTVGGYVSEINYDIDQDTAIQMLLSGEEELAADTQSDTASKFELGDEEKTDISADAVSEGEVSTEQAEVDTSELTGDVNETKSADNNMIIIAIVIAAAVLLIAVVIVVIVLCARGGKNSSSEKYVGLTLTRVKDQKAVSKRLKSSLSFGRAGKCDFCFPDDNALSDYHCYFIFENQRVFVQDNKSTNGVFVNGVPQFGKCALSNGDMVLIGSYEYRVSWT